MQDKSRNREIGDLAVWSVTSFKPGNGVELLRDRKLDTYWQSDGAQPHLINVQFQKKVQLTAVHLYLDFKLDESYTPSKISIRVGTSYQDLKEVESVEVDEPSGWVKIPLIKPHSQEPLSAFFLQVAILANHQSGRDTHVRLIDVYGPRKDFVGSLGQPISFTSHEFYMHATLR